MLVMLETVEMVVAAQERRGATVATEVTLIPEKAETAVMVAIVNMVKAEMVVTAVTAQKEVAKVEKVDLALAVKVKMDKMGIKKVKDSI
jgi:hypothetical protein